jgi:hypothetical protein
MPGPARGNPGSSFESTPDTQMQPAIWPSITMGSPASSDSARAASPQSRGSADTSDAFGYAAKTGADGLVGCSPYGPSAPQYRMSY